MTMMNMGIRRLAVILTLTAVTLLPACAGGGDDDDDDDSDSLAAFCGRISECDLGSALGISSMDDCRAFVDTLTNETVMCVLLAASCDEVRDCLGLGGDDDADDDTDDDADDDTEYECVEAPSWVNAQPETPELTDGELYALRCPDAADPEAFEEVTLQYSSDNQTTGSTGWDDGAMEGVRFTPEHPFHLKSLEFYFYNDCGDVTVRLVPDLLGSVFVVDGDLTDPARAAIPADAGWSELPAIPWDFIREPDEPFWIVYEHVQKYPFLGQDDLTNDLRSVFWDQNWALQNSPWTHGNPQHNYMVRAHGNYFCKQEEKWFSDATEVVDLGPDLHRQRTVWADINNDGWDDVIVSTGGYEEAGFSVFLNDEGTFTDITEASGLNGWGAGVALLADFDNDGNLDAYLGVNTPQDNVLDYYSTILLGDGLGSFTEVPDNGVDVLFDVTLYGEDVTRRPSHVAITAADYDEDGIVDLYAGNWEVEYPNALSYPDILFRGNGDGTFEDVSAGSGINPYDRPAYGATFGDYNNDGWADIGVANYGGSPNFLLENQGDGTFSEVAIAKGFARGGDGKSGTSFGIDFGDIDNDGDLDAYQSNIQHPRFEGVTGGSVLHLNSGAPDFTFTDITTAAGISRDEGEIDGSFADFDNDGRLDLFVSDLYTGHYGRLFRQMEDGSFEDVTYESGIFMHDCTNHAWGDFDMDGDLDLLVTRRSDGMQVHLWRNEIGQNNNWVTFRLQGDGVATNTSACGARVTLVAGSLTQVREVQCGRGHASAGPSLPVEFGLGSNATIDSVTVDWPGGSEETWEDPPIERFIRLVQGQPTLEYYDE